MKKQILSAILMAAVILTATACSGKTEVSEASSQRESEVTAEAAPESAPAATVEKQEREDAATTTESTTEAPTKEVEEIKDYKLFQHGCLVFNINNDSHVYNAVDNKMYELGGDITARDIQL